MNRLWGGLLAGALLCGATGCKSIRRIPIRHRELPVASAEAARALHEEGLKFYRQQPRTVERVRDAAGKLEQAARSLPDEAELQWQAAEALAFLGEYEKSAEERAKFAERGVVLARRAKQLQPDRAEGHFWYAVTAGLLADADREYGLTAVGEMESALRKAVELDPKYDHGAPLRTLGLLLVRAPGPPLSIGSPRRGLRYLQQAVETSPEYPENHLYLAEAFHVVEQADKAREQLDFVLNSKMWDDRQYESKVWRDTAQKWKSEWFDPKRSE